MLWREYAKKITTPHQRHQLIMLRERIVGPWSQITAKHRVLPDFIIIGGPRCGTTNLFNTLRHHPQIKTARIKEVKFFNNDKKYNKGESYYRSFFPFVKKVKANQVVGEASPNYLSSEEGAERIGKMLPEAKLIVLLRNPTQRFFSGYFYKKQKANHKHIKYPSLEEMVLDKNFENSEYFLSQLYLPKLKMYDSYFQKGNLLVLNSEDYFKSPDKILRQVCDYLNIENTYQFPEIKSRNRALLREPVSDEVVKKLNISFAPYNELLYRYINRDLGW